MADILLSICISTYNRSQYLMELVKSILSINSSRIEVVITDCLSTDDTIEKLLFLGDPRIRICKNNKQKPPYQYLLESIFSGSGKYTMYCNDRDLIIADRIPIFLEFLDGKEFSFVYTTRIGKRNSLKYQEYDGIYESIYHLPPACHPTGMVFNTELLHEHIRINSYEKYMSYIYFWNFLMRDLSLYGNTAIYDLGLWNERPAEFKISHRSGVLNGKDAFFFPQRISDIMKETLTHSLSITRFDSWQKSQIGKNIIFHFLKRLVLYKYNMMSPYETEHYGIKKRFISIIKMCDIYKFYHKDWLDFLKKKSFCEIEIWWKGSYRKYYLWFILACIYVDMLSVKLYFSYYWGSRSLDGEKEI